MQTFAKKGIFHSELVRAAEHGLIVKLTNGPIKSQYPGKGDSGYFIPFQVYQDDGPTDGDDYTYTIENDDILSYLSHAPVNVWMKLFAQGSRSSATVSLEDEHGTEVVSASPQQPPPQASASGWPEGAGSRGEWPDAAAEPQAQDPPDNVWPEPSGPALLGRKERLEAAADEARVVFQTIFPMVYLECLGSFDTEADQPFPSAAVVEAAKALTSTVLIQVEKGRR